MSASTEKTAPAVAAADGAIQRSWLLQRHTVVIVGTLIVGSIAFGFGATVWRAYVPPLDQAHESESRRDVGRPAPSRLNSSEAVPNWRPEHMLAGPQGSLSLPWEFLGPMPTCQLTIDGPVDYSGRIAAIAVHPVAPDTVYVASASGGVWKTVDGGLQWVPLTDELPTLNHGCVALDPSNPEVVYVGTGEYLTGLLGDGLFRSPDGGTTWERLATADQVGTTCSMIIVDPNDPSRIHVTGNLGYIRSDDGGTTWVGHLAGDASDMVMHPTDASRLYVGHRPDGVYRSTDGGDNWTLLGNGLPNIQTLNVVLDIAQSNPNVLYAAISEEGVSIGLEGIYRSTDGGNTWSGTPGTDPPLGRTSWNLALAVDPTDENTVFLLGFGLYRSQNAGTSWQRITDTTSRPSLHVDYQAVTVGPDETVWLGNDGGMWKSADGGQSWTNLNATLGITQLYYISHHPTDSERFMGGSQDNGFFERTSVSGLRWDGLSGGDGGHTAFDSVNPSVLYLTALTSDALFRSTDGVIENISGPWGGETIGGGVFATDPNIPHTLLWGSSRVWRTQDADAGANWTPLSEPLTEPVFGTVITTALAVAEGASDTIYVGTNSGSIFTTVDAKSWTMHIPVPGQISGVARIDIHPVDSSRACAAMGSFATTVVCTNDLGVTWSDLSTNFPADLYARTLAVDWRQVPPAIYVGTSVGIYASMDSGSTWQKDGTAFPNVIVTDLVIDRSTSTLIAGTHGRGVWRALLPNPLITCGNGIVDPDEICDTAIPTGVAGACPTTCNSGDSCVVGILLSPGTCQAECEFVTITDPIPNDGCCLPGTPPGTDNDCVGIPTVSEWGLTILAIVMLSAGTAILRSSRSSLKKNFGPDC